MVAVGTTIAGRPPHRTVRAPLCIRLPPWMSGDEVFQRIGMQDAGHWYPAREDRVETIPRQHAALTTATKYQPPQSAQALPEDTQPVEVSRDRMVSVVAHNNLMQPFAN